MDALSKKLELTDKQVQIFHQFKSNVEDILNPLHTDDILLKYLRARNFDHEEAEDNYRAVYSTRKLFSLDGIADTYVPSELFQRYATDSFLGFAKDGTAVRYVTARVDIMGFLYSASMYELGKYFFYCFETDLKTMRDENLKTGRDCNEITYIMDMEGYSLHDFTHKCVIETGLDLFRILQDYYPEVWRNIFFVNVPSIFDKIFYIFKPILKETLVQKIQVATKSSTPELLRNYIEDSVLPAFLGGKKVDSKGDPKCKEFVRSGGKIPEKYYLKNCRRLIQATDPGVKVVVIGARSVFNIPLVVREAKTRIRMEARTENGSIVFGVFYRDFGTDPENPDLPESDEYLDPYDEKSNVRVSASKLRSHLHLAPSNGEGVTDKPGIYIVQFDNTGSWFSSRKLFYRFTIIPKE